MDKKEKKPEEISLKDTRKKVVFIRLDGAGIAPRNIKNVFKRPDKFDNLEKIQFKCQPKSKDSSHTSLEGIGKNTPVKEIIYRLIVNNRGRMKLGDISESTLEILKGRKLSGLKPGDDANLYFYNLLKEDSEYEFEEVE